MKDDNDKFILMNMNDERSKLVAEVLGNKTCKAMVDYLSETNEASQQDIAKALNVPLNTVDYNLKKLVKSGLVEKAKNFFWSKKGKRIEMYKLAKKYIIISPRSKPNLDILKTILPLFIAIIGIAAIAFFIQSLYPFDNGGKSLIQDELKHFNSNQEIKDFLKAGSEASNYGNYNGIRYLDKAASNMPTMAESTSGASVTSSDGIAQSYSTTNIQVEGVDEPDIVKNDGKYIYTISGNKIVILEAYPAEDMKIVGEINLSGLRNMFVNEDKLIVFTNEYLPTYEFNAKSSSAVCYGCERYGGKSASGVFVYNLEDRSNPKLEQNASVEGSYNDARMIGDYVYLISTKSAYVENPEPPVYILNGVEKQISADSVYYFDNSDTSYVFSTITALNIKSGDTTNRVYLTGYTGILYVSEKNIYLTYQRRTSQKDYLQSVIDEVLIPILPSDEKVNAKEILDSDKEYYQKYNEITDLVQGYSRSLTGNEKAEFDLKLKNSIESMQAKMQKESEKTVIHKIGVDKLDIEYKKAGEVPGHVLNQFSMDEYNGKFRIATTTGQVSRTSDSSLNHLYVLDEELKVTGKVEDLAKGEKIYSARFMQDRAYIVTFKKVDPLFVIDLKNPENPAVLGYLKITGYSDYLHPYDENHVIGIGKETAGGNEQFSYYQGVKISLFDVSDVENPMELAKYEIGDRGTDSPALRDHKAVLFDKDKNLLVLPISLYELNEEGYSREVQANAYGEFVWQGAYVLNISLEGIALRGKITHDDSVLENTYRYSNYNAQIQRSLYMDDVLYTISQTKVKANQIDSVEEITSVLINLEKNREVIEY